MKIAQIAPLWYRIPPLKYGGTERVIHALTNGLYERGHEVSLFATADSQTKAKLIAVVDKGIVDRGLSFTDYYPEMQQVLNVLDAKDKFDIIHFHFSMYIDYALLALLNNSKLVVTLHIPLPPVGDPRGRDVLWRQRFNKIPVVTVSNNQRRPLPTLHYVATVYNGTPACEPNLQNTPVRDNILWLGLFMPTKGADVAIKVAQASQKKIVLGGKIDSNVDESVRYFRQQIEPTIDGNMVEFIDEIDSGGRTQQLSRAKLFLYPIDWEEPFGLVMVEALACGTPIVAFARGSVPEIVRDGETGYIVNSSDYDKRGNWIIEQTGVKGLSAAVARLYSLSEKEYQIMRRNCRERFEKMFTTEKMVKKYENVYQKLL